MEPGGTAPDGEVLDGVVIAEAMGDDGGIELVFTKLDFLFVQPDVKTGIGFLEVHHVEIVYQHIRKDGPSKNKRGCLNSTLKQPHKERVK